jgi:hypothetical protein
VLVLFDFEGVHPGHGADGRRGVGIIEHKRLPVLEIMALKMVRGRSPKITRVDVSWLANHILLRLAILDRHDEVTLSFDGPYFVDNRIDIVFHIGPWP